MDADKIFDDVHRAIEFILDKISSDKSIPDKDDKESVMNKGDKFGIFTDLESSEVMETSSELENVEFNSDPESESSSNKVGIFSDLESSKVMECSSEVANVIVNTDHDSYCSKKSLEMEDKTKSDDLESKSSNTEQDMVVDIVEKSTSDTVPSQLENKDVPMETSASLPTPSTDSALQEKSKSSSKVLEILPRATRSSQNPDFAAKHRKFLSSKLKREVDSDNSESTTSPAVRALVNKDSTQRKSQDSLKDSSSEIKVNRKRDIVTSKLSVTSVGPNNETTGEKRKNTRNENYEPSIIEGEVDCYCWRCHRDGSVIACETCPRVYHLRCIRLDFSPGHGWVCPECSTVMHAENIDTRSKAMKMLTLDQLCKLLQFAVNRMKSYEGAEEFAKPVDTQQFEHYRNFIVKPMDLSLLEENIKNNLYGSTEAFLADAKWILHNCVIFNTVQSKFTNVARTLLKICRQEMLEIENCPDCYQNAHTRSSDSWFIEACRRPHVLVWAKLKGFPFWPAKAMSTNNENQVDVRFFGAHDRAWVPASACFLYSKMPPVQTIKKKNNLEECVQELEAHIKKLRDKFGTFEHAPYKTPYNPTKDEEQLMLLLPNFDPKRSLTKRIGRLLHDRVRPSTNIAPEKKELKKEKPETHKERTDLKRTEKSESSQKRKAGPNWGPKHESKVKCINISKEETCNKKNVSPPVETEEVSAFNDEYDSLSPPKFFISKLGLQKSKVIAGPSNETKLAFVDKLQEKLSRLEKTNKLSEENDSTEDDKEKTASKSCTEETSTDDENKKKDVDKYAEITKIKSVVVLHDLKNNKVLSEKFRNCTVQLENEDIGSRKEKQGQRDIDKDVMDEIPTAVENEKEVIQISSSSCSVCSEIEEEIVEVNSESEKTNEVNKKKKNINSVVETIKERKSSTDSKNSDKSIEKDNGHTEITRTEDMVKNSNEKNKEQLVVPSSSTGPVDVIPAVVETKSPSDLSNDENEVSSTRADGEKTNLDNSEYPLVVIDEHSEDNMSSSSSVKEIPIANNNKILKSCLETIDKPDKNRRKGIPAKVCSRQSFDIEEDTINSTRQSLDQDGVEKAEDSSIVRVLDEVSGRFTKTINYQTDTVDAVRRYTRDNEETNVTINVTSDESSLNKTAPKEIRASVNLSKDVSLSVLGDSVPSTLDMECVSDSEEPVLMNENIPDFHQQIRPPVKKLTTKPVKVRAMSIMKNVNLQKTVQKRKSVGSIEGNSVFKSQSLPVHDPRKLNTSVPLKLHNGHPVVQHPPLKNGQNHLAQPLHLKSGQNNLVQPPPLKNGQNLKLLHLHKGNQTMEPMASPSLNAHLDRLSQKLSSRFRIMLEELLKELSADGCSEAKIKGLQIEMERMQWRHKQEMAEMKHNSDLVVFEVRASLEAEKQRILAEVKQKFEQEKELAVQETKCKQWCASCRKEALLYCCWNTAYCSYPCQQTHWYEHMNMCAQGGNPQVSDNAKAVVRVNGGGAAVNNSRVLPMPNPPQMHDKSHFDIEEIDYSETGDFINNNNEDSVDNLVQTKPPRRKRCGECEGCSQLTNCQNCRTCLNERSHQVCLKRRCSNLINQKSSSAKRQILQTTSSITSTFMQLTVPPIHNPSRNVGVRQYMGPVPPYMPMIHHQLTPGGYRPPQNMPNFQHQVFMN